MRFETGRCPNGDGIWSALSYILTLQTLLLPCSLPSLVISDPIISPGFLPTTESLREFLGLTRQKGLSPA